MSTAHTTYEIQESLAVLTFNRPEARNAMTWEMYDALLAACEDVDRDPAILLAPQDQGRTAYLAIARRDLVGVFLIHLRDLAIERGLACRAEPRGQVRRELLIRHGAPNRVADIGRHDRLMDVSRKAAECRLVLPHVCHEG